MSRRVQNGKVISIAYVLLDENGNQLEEKTPENPLVYVHGHDQIHEAIERALEGQTPGFTTSIRLGAHEAYGPFKPDLAVEIPRSNFAEGMEIRSGMKFNTVGPDGKPVVVRVVEVDEKIVTVDGNHPLAGVGLIFEVRILDVRDASSDEAKTGLVMPQTQKKSGLH